MTHQTEPGFSVRKSLIHLWCGIALSFGIALPAGAQEVGAQLGELEFKSGYPTNATAEKLYDELDFQRAVQAYLWALPMASYGALADAHRAIGVNDHTVLVAEKSAQPRQLILTANRDTIYLSGVLDLQNGPIVMDVPTGLLGTLNNIWQQPLADIGGPFSPEQNRGGRFLIVPPNYDGPMPAQHHHVAVSDTNTVVFYLRAVPKTKDDLPKLLELVKQYRQYRLADAGKPPETRFILGSGMTFDTLTKEGFGYFENLARYVNDNPPRPQDMAMLGMLETLGIAHGRAFKPDERMTQILTKAAEVGRAMAKTLAYKPRIADDLLYLYPGKRRWKNIFFGDPTFHTPDYMAIDQRAKYTFEAIGTAKSMVVAAPGQGSQYAGAYQDKDGAWLSGENTYRMRFPANIPAKDFWSLTVYDNTTRSMIQNESGVPLVGSVHGVKTNADGSVDIYFGPKLPKGVAKENFVQTNPGKGWFAYIRLYGPEKPWFDQQWIPGDAELVKK